MTRNHVEPNRRQEEQRKQERRGVKGNRAMKTKETEKQGRRWEGKGRVREIRHDREAGMKAKQGTRPLTEAW